MHILILHQIFVTPGEGGGTRHFELASFLAKRGHKITVICSDTDYLTGKKKQQTSTKFKNLRIIYCPTIRSLHKSFMGRALSFASFALTSFFYALTTRDVDVVWGTSPPLFQALSSLIAAKLKKSFFVFEVRDLWVDFAKELGILKRASLYQVLKSIEKRIYLHSDRIIVNTPGFIPSISKYVGKEKITLITNGVTTSDFELPIDTPLEFKNRYCGDGSFVAIYIGNIGVANDIDTILKAAESLKAYKDIFFVLMGGGIKMENTKDYISKNKLDNVLIIDSQPKSEIPKILADIDVGIALLMDIPSFNTTYPNKVFDYMAAGKPTILGIKGVIKDVIESSSGGTAIDPENPEQLAKAILRYYKDSKVKAIHGDNARQYVKKHFEREMIAEKLEELLLSLGLH